MRLASLWTEPCPSTPSFRRHFNRPCGNPTSSVASFGAGSERERECVYRIRVNRREGIPRLANTSLIARIEQGMNYASEWLRAVSLATVSWLVIIFIASTKSKVNRLLWNSLYIYNFCICIFDNLLINEVSRTINYLNIIDILSFKKICLLKRILMKVKKSMWNVIIRKVCFLYQHFCSEYGNRTLKIKDV